MLEVHPSDLHKVPKLMTLDAYKVMLDIWDAGGLFPPVGVGYTPLASAAPTDGSIDTLGLISILKPVA